MKVYVLSYAHSPKEEPLNVASSVFISLEKAKDAKERLMQSLIKDGWKSDEEYERYGYLYIDDKEAVVQIDEHEI